MVSKSQSTPLFGDPYAFFRGEFVPLKDAKVNVMTHALRYGTGMFEGIRGNWNEEQGAVNIFRLREPGGKASMTTWSWPPPWGFGTAKGVRPKFGGLTTKPIFPRWNPTL